MSVWFIMNISLQFVIVHFIFKDHVSLTANISSFTHSPVKPLILTYRKPPNISPGPIFVLFGGLIHGQAYIRGGAYILRFTVVY